MIRRWGPKRGRWMSDATEAGRDGSSGRGTHRHRRRFTEGLLDEERILESLKMAPGQTILDAGCGNGYMSRVFSKEVGRSGKVYALDPDRYYIDLLASQTKGTNIEAMAGDITKPTRFGDSSVDLIYISTVIHGFSRVQMQGFLTEAKRLLAPGGRLAIVEIEKRETPFGPPVEFRYSPEDLKEIVPLAPLDTVQVGEHFYMQVFRNME